MKLILNRGETLSCCCKLTTEERKEIFQILKNYGIEDFKKLLFTIKNFKDVIEGKKNNMFDKFVKEQKYDEVQKLKLYQDIQCHYYALLIVIDRLEEFNLKI